MPYYPPSGSSYPYSAYHPPPQNSTYSASHVQTPGAYPTSAYQTSYPTSVQGYGAWPYAAYSYYQPQQQQQQTAQQQQQQQGQQARPQQPAKPTVKASTSTPTTPVPPSAPVGATAQTQMYTPAQYAPGSAAQTMSTMSTMTSTMAPRPSYTSSYTYIPSYRDTLAAASSGGSRGVGGKKSTFRGLFAKELRNLMYGFGDDRNPANDTVNVMEEILVEYIVDVCQTALAPGKKARLSIEDLRRALSRPADAKKLARMEELLFMQEDIKRARAQFEESDMNQASYQS